MCLLSLHLLFSKTVKPQLYVLEIQYFKNIMSWSIPQKVQWLYSYSIPFVVNEVAVLIKLIFRRSASDPRFYIVE